MRSSYLEQNSGKFFQERPTVQAEFSCTGTTLTMTTSVPVPAGAYVTKVALAVTGRIGSQDLDVGDGDKVDRFFGQIVSASSGAIMVAPHNHVATNVAGGAVAGKYYAAADTIDVTSDVTGSLDDRTGTAILMVWYYV